MTGAGGDAATVVFEMTVILVAIAIGSFIKGLTGAGLPQLAIPVMAVFLGVERAVVVMAAPVMLANTWLLWAHRTQLRASRDLPVLLVAGVVGAVIGTIGLQRLDAALLSLVMAGAVILYVVLQLRRPDLQLPPRLAQVLSPPVGFAAGVLQGATGVSGPFVMTYVHSLRLPRPVYIVSIVTMFQVFGLAQVVTLAQLGMYSTTRIVESGLVLAPMMIMLPLGARMSERMSERSFDVAILVLLAGSALVLLYEGIIGLAS